jgi:hypothetical protein
MSTKDKCIYPGCFRIAKFNYAKGKRDLYCRKHASGGMVDKIDKIDKIVKCVLCDRQVSNYAFGIPKGLFCALHYRLMLELLEYSEDN